MGCTPCGFGLWICGVEIMFLVWHSADIMKSGPPLGLVHVWGG